MLSVLRPPFWVQFVNETDVPIKIVSGTVGWRKTNLKFVQDVLPHSSHAQGLAYSSFHTFSSGGYLIIYLNGMLNPNSVRPEGDVRVVEFAMSGAMLDFFSEKINIRDITSGEFLSGQDTYNAVKSGEAKTLYWFDRGVHYMARAEIVRSFFGVVIWRFVVQNFDPLTVQD